MSKLILGTKGQMTTVFTEEGRAHAATVIVAAPNTVTQVKTLEKDGYVALQVGAVDTKPARVNKAQLGHTKGKPLVHFRELREVKLHAEKLHAEMQEVGSTVDVSAFA